jgi:hypothetical protein
MGFRRVEGEKRVFRYFEFLVYGTSAASRTQTDEISNRHMRDEMSAHTQSTFHVSYVCSKYVPVTGKFAKTVKSAIFGGQKCTEITK